MFERDTPSRGRLAGTLGAGLAALLLGAVLAASCGSTPDDASAPPDATTTVTDAPTSQSSISAPTTSTTTTAVPPTTATTRAWPRGPVKSLPAAGAVPVISRVDTTDPVIFLTIDDGMVRDPRIPELLAQFKVPATLFLNQGPYLADPDYFMRVIASGGSINSHTKSHPKLTGMSANAQRNEICGMKDIIAQHVFVPGHLFRAPFGASNTTTQSAAGSCGINAVLFWRAALNDGRVQYQQGNQLQPGDIVLSHFRDDLYDNIRALLWQCAVQGLTIAPIEDYLPLPGGG